MNIRKIRFDLSVMYIEQYFEKVVLFL